MIVRESSVALAGRAHSCATLAWPTLRPTVGGCVLANTDPLSSVRVLLSFGSGCETKRIPLEWNTQRDPGPELGTLPTFTFEWIEKRK